MPHPKHRWKHRVLLVAAYLEDLLIAFDLHNQGCYAAVVGLLIPLCDPSRYGYERELMTLLNQLCRDMNRKIERQKERAIIESSARPLNAEDKARLDAIKVRCKC